jgi:hypothetical protein
MGKFANYDVRQWLADGVLSQHPESQFDDIEAPKRRDGGVAVAANFAYSVVLAASMALLPGLSTGEVTHQHETSMRPLHSPAIGTDADKVYWFEAAPSAAITNSTVAAGFDSYFKEIHGQLLAGGLLDVPTQTRDAARLALSRTAPNNWIEKLASDLAKLTD